jgi:hypothetical protein
MPDKQFAFGTITAFSAPEGASATLRLESIGELRYERSHRAFAVWSRLLMEAHASGEPVLVEYDGATRLLSDFFFPDTRKVLSIAPAAKEGRLQVMFELAPSPYFLRTASPGFGAMKALLERALKSKIPLLVTSHRDTQEILDVRKTPPPRH